MATDNTATTAAKPPVKRVKVKLTYEGHEHRGKPCKKGDVIDVTDDQAQRLVKSKRGELA